MPSFARRRLSALWFVSGGFAQRSTARLAALWFVSGGFAQRSTARLSRPLAPLAALCLLVSAGPVCACSDRASVWDWDRCWLSLPRWLLLAAVGAGWWFLCFHRLFPALLSP